MLTQGRRDRRDGAARRRRQHARRSRRPLDWREHRRRRVPRRRSPAGWRSRARARAVLGAGGAARAVAVALGSQGAAVTICARQAGCREEVAALAGGQRRALAAAAGHLGRARQRDLVRAAAGRTTTRWTACRSTARSCSTWSTRRPDTPLLERARTRGLPDDRRHRDARRAGRAAVRAVDRAAAAGRAVQAAAASPRPATTTSPRRRTGREADDVRRIRGAGAARHVRAGGQGDHRGPADAGVGVSEDRRALRLRVPVRERGRRRAGRALFVPRQGSVPRPAPARRHARSSIAPA